MIQKIWINLYWSPQNQAPTTAFCFCFHHQSSIPYSVCHLSAYSILIDSVFHSRWLPYVLFLLTHTHSFHQFYIKLPKATILYSGLLISQPFSLSAWPLVCYRSIQLLPQSFWLHWACHIYCRHFYIYYGFCCSVYLSVSIVISLLSLCWCWMSVVQLALSFIIFLSIPSQKSCSIDHRSLLLLTGASWNCIHLGWINDYFIVTIFQYLSITAFY